MMRGEALVEAMVVGPAGARVAEGDARRVRLTVDRSADLEKVLTEARSTAEVVRFDFTVIFTLAAIYGLFRIGARLYRNAILHTGARLHLREAWRGEQVPQQPTSGTLGRTAA
jgi:hypothetical protein